MTRWSTIRVQAAAEEAVQRLLTSTARRRAGVVAEALEHVPQSVVLEVADQIAVDLAQIIEAGCEISPRAREHLRDEVLHVAHPFGWVEQ